MVEFPIPIGGTVLPADFAPAIVFAVLFACLFPLMVYRMFSRRSRSVLLIGTVCFSIERIVLFSLRAVQAREESFRNSHGLITYMQTSWAIGFVGIGSDLVNVIRCLLINPTYGSDMYNQSPASRSKGGIITPPPENTLDQPELRKRLRHFSGFMGLSFLVPTIIGAVGIGYFDQVYDKQNTADFVARMRLASTAVALVLILVLMWAVILARINLPRVSKRGTNIALSILCLLSVVSIYRLSVMNRSVTSLGPNILDEPGERAAFYLFHVLPEWLSMLIIFSDNNRKTFGTGLAGDYRGKDKKPEDEKKKMEDNGDDEEKFSRIVETEVEKKSKVNVALIKLA